VNWEDGKGGVASERGEGRRQSEQRQKFEARVLFSLSEVNYKWGTGKKLKVVGGGDNPMKEANGGVVQFEWSGWKGWVGDPQRGPEKVKEKMGVALSGENAHEHKWGGIRAC